MESFCFLGSSDMLLERRLDKNEFLKIWSILWNNLKISAHLHPGNSPGGVIFMAFFLVQDVCLTETHNILVGGFKDFFNVHPYLGKIPILTNIFQMGWFNHQPVFFCELSDSSLVFWCVCLFHSESEFPFKKLAASFWGTIHPCYTNTGSNTPLYWRVQSLADS